MSHGPQQTHAEADPLTAWCAATLAYRNARRAGQRNYSAWCSARDAVLDLNPGMDIAMAGREASRAIAYVSVLHSVWFWNGVGVTPEIGD
jgi:hypothetical protein